MRPGRAVLAARAVPPFLLGGGLAVTGEVAVGLLLYTGPGFVPALSVILAVLFLSLAVGIRVGAGGGGGDRVEAARRRWLHLMLAVSMAALFAGSWEVFRGFGATAFTQGLGLAFVAALPLYAGGTVLGELARARASGGGVGRGAVAALTGAGLGVLLAGHVLLIAFSPTAILLLCLMAFSFGALVHGRTLDRVVSVRPVGVREENGWQVRVERWVRGRPRLVRTAFLEGDRLRVLVDEDGGPSFWDEAVVEEGLSSWAPEVRTAMVLGGGGGALAARLAAGGDREVWLADGNEALLATLAAELSPPDRGTVRTRPASPSELLLHGPGSLPEGSFDLIVLEWAERPAGERLDRLPPPALQRLHEALAPGGVLVLFPLGMDPVTGEEGLLHLARDVGRRFSQAVLYVGRNQPEPAADAPPSRREAWERLRPGKHPHRAVLVAGPDDGAPWPERVGEFLQVSVDRRDQEVKAGPGEAPPADEVADASRPSL